MFITSSVVYFNIKFWYDCFFSNLEIKLSYFIFHAIGKKKKKKKSLSN